MDLMETMIGDRFRRNLLLGTTGLATVMCEAPMLAPLRDLRDGPSFDEEDHLRARVLIAGMPNPSIRSPADDPRQKPVRTANGRGVIAR